MIDELSQDHWEAAIGFIPFMPAVIGPSGRLVLKNAAGQVIEAFDGPVIQSINAAREYSQFAHRWQALLGSGLTHDQAKRLVYAGFIRPNQSYKGLRNAMEAIGDLPPAGMNPATAQAHHELPWRGWVNNIDGEESIPIRDVFAQWGFDVNNPQFGHWVVGNPHGQHQSWSGQWRREWEEFLDPTNTNSTLYGVTDITEGQNRILEKLQQMREGYALGGPFETGNPLD